MCACMCAHTHGTMHMWIFLYFSFKHHCFREEYYKANPELAATWNIKNKEYKEEQIDKMETVDSLNEDEEIKKVLVETSEELLKGKSNKALNK